MIISECTKSISTDMTPDLALQHSGGLDMSICDKASEHDPCGFCFQFYYCRANFVIHSVALIAWGYAS